MTNHEPEVSVCIPVFNAVDWIERAVRSALDQTHEDLEVVVVDNASTDGTRERVQSIDDPRLRLYRNPSNLGMCPNWNRAMALARGRYIKFLCADDVIYPDCVEAMLPLFRDNPTVGLVFSRREIVLEDPDDAGAVAWKEKHELAHERFGQLREVNGGDELLAPWIADQLANNWVGEPTNVMMSRECLDRIGGFNLHMRSKQDMELFVRAMLFYSVGFVDRPLSEFLVRSGSVTHSLRESGQDWLDRLWFLEGLLSYPEARRRYRRLHWLRAKAIMRIAKQGLTRDRIPRSGKLAALRPWARVRLGRSDRAKIYGEPLWGR